MHEWTREDSLKEEGNLSLFIFGMHAVGQLSFKSQANMKDPC